MPILALALLLAASTARALGADVSPATPRPGDPVLVTAYDAPSAPEGTFAGRPLRFFPVKKGWRAVSALPVEQPPGAAPLVLRAGDRSLEKAIEIRAPAWRERELAVAKSFTAPSAAQKKRQEADQKAFERAWATPFAPPRFLANFRLPRASEITAPFGDRRTFNGKVETQHYGLDLDGRVGASVAAANDGRVVMVRDNFAAGRTVVLEHGAGIFTAYFHLSRVDVKAGQRVARGVRIGRVGRSGRVTGPHLHFAARVDGLYVDPAVLVGIDWAER